MLCTHVCIVDIDCFMNNSIIIILWGRGGEGGENERELEQYMNYI